MRQQGVAALIPRLPQASTVVCWAAVPALVIGAVAMPAGARTLAPVTATGDGVTVPQPTYQPGGRMLSVGFIGNSVPKSLITTFRQSNHPDIRPIDITNVGCDPLDAPRYTDGKIQPEQEACQAWRDGWATEVTAQEPDVVVFFVAQSLVTDRYADGEVVEFGSPEWEGLVTDGLDRAREAAGSRRFAVINLSCHEMPTFGTEEIERVNDTEYVRTLNATVAEWAEETGTPVLDQYSLLCEGDEFHDTINEVPLYEDAIHFTIESGPIFWRWLAPRLQRISQGVDPD